MIQIVLNLIKLIFIINLVKSNPYKLNVPKVLLPFHSSKLISFTLEANSELSANDEDLCFVWSSSRPDVVSITPVYQNNTQKFNGYECSNRAVVSAVSKHSQRLTSIIFAKEIKTDKLIRCDVIVDQIRSIRIKHTTTHLYLEDSPESFTAEALDSDKNTFTSIDGLPFEWKIISDEINDDSRNVLRISKFTDSEYQVSESIEHLESIGLNGHKVLIEGIKTGTAKVQAKLIDPFYKDTLKTEPVRLLVVANILIEPSYPVYLLKGTSIKYSVFLIKQTSVEKIVLPSQQYYFDTRNKTVANFEEKSGSQLLANNLGQTEIILIDRNMKEELFNDQKIALPPPSALVNVVQAEYLTYEIKNWRSWILESGRTYEIQISLYTTQRELIYPADNLRIQSEFPKLSIRDKTLNGTFVIAKALEKGTSILKGFLVGNENVRGQQEIEILDPITVQPEILIFAYNPNGDNYEYELTTRGGSGSYYYQTKNTTIAKINSEGILHVFSNQLGHTKILVTDQRNFDIKAESKLFVIEPIDLVIEPCPVEARVNTKLGLNIKMNALLDNNIMHAVTDCSKLNFNVLLHDQEVFKYVRIELPEKNSNYCAKLILEANKVGKTSIRIFYENLSSQELQISSYSQLTNPKKRLLLTKSSSYLINLYDGPIVSDSQSYLSEYQITTQNSIKVEHLEHDSIGGKYSYRITCLKNDVETEIKFHVSNRQTSNNKCPLKFEYILPVRCAIPKRLELSQMFVNNDESDLAIYSGLKWNCPIKSSSKYLMANKIRNLNIQLVVKDSNGHEFDNFTSLKLNWQIDNNYMTKIDEPKFISLRPLNENSLTKVASEGFFTFFYQSFKPKEKSGESSIEAKLIIEENNYINDKLTVKFVDDVKVEPVELVLFNHPSNFQQLKLNFGSGYFFADVESKDQNVLKIAKITDQTIQISPLQNNGACLVNIYDFCIPPESMSLNRDEFIWEPTTKSNVKVAGINSIMVNYEDDKVQEGDKLKIDVQIIDASGNLIQSKYFKLMNLEPKIIGDSNLAKVEINNDESLSDNAAIFIFTGLKQGFLTIEFEAKSDNKIIKSSQKKIEIFAPILIEPKQVELIVGSEYQIQYTGGPVLASDMNVKFSILDKSDLIKINEIGLVTTHKIGTVVVSVTFSNSHKLYAKDTVIINIVEMKFVKLNAPLNSIKAGNQIQVYVTANNLSPFYYAANNKINYEWFLSNEELVTVEPKNSFAINLKTKRAGVLKISVKVEYMGKVFKDSIELTILMPGYIENFETKFDTYILITSKTSWQIKSNYDSINSDITYEMQYFTQLNDCSNSSVQISKSGLLQVGDVRSSECIVGLLVKIKLESKIENLLILIKVKPIIYSMFNVDGQKITVSYHDNLGDKFYVVNTKNTLRINRNDLIDFTSLNRQVFNNGLSTAYSTKSEENTFYLQNLKLGYFIMEITSSNSLPGYYAKEIKLLENERKDIYVGDLICNLTLETSGNVYLVKVKSGLIGVASNPGHVLLGKNNEINIKPIEKVKLLRKKKFFTNAKDLQDSDYNNFVEFQINDHKTDLECSNEFEKFFVQSFNPFKCQVGLYNVHNQKLNYFDRLLKTEVLYHDQNWLCNIGYIQNSEQILYDLMENHIDQTSGITGYRDQEPVYIKVFIDSKNSNLNLEEDIENQKTNRLEFIPAFYLQTKIVELPAIRSFKFDLVIKATFLLAQHLVVTTNIPTLIKIGHTKQDSFTQVYEIETLRFDLNEYANVLQQQNGNLYIQVINTMNQQIERVPVKFLFSSGIPLKSNELEIRQRDRFNFLYNMFEFTPNQITNILILVSLFLMTVLIILKLKTSSQKLSPTMSPTRAATPKSAPSGSFNPASYFPQSINNSLINTSPRRGLSNKNYQDQIAPGTYQNLTSPQNYSQNYTSFDTSNFHDTSVFRRSKNGYKIDN